jgi:hypothetical protein
VAAKNIPKIAENKFSDWKEISKNAKPDVMIIYLKIL